MYGHHCYSHPERGVAQMSELSHMDAKYIGRRSARLLSTMPVSLLELVNERGNEFDVDFIDELIELRSICNDKST